ncbi:hypothetical protein BJF89_13845 [Corynebacterium sp. CNJ-954]|uniref:hypothetical protein n=1 Tax=Corynebacterium sp. CNJ-954 TaxID=1904962 RepID=UPI0009655567|nr:hypothetical protein [Corynebacterium sp. CNJ-954]OLT55865.1 hypothetical protein BJF89_13845 [Corynebacterium sp. CNJ-954]
MTPEEAQALEPGTTPGPWKANHSQHGVSYVTEQEWYGHIGSGENGHVEAEYTPADADLIAAAPDMRATIAAQTWEYGVERSDRGGPPYTVWYESEHAARQATQRPHLVDRDARLVRRPVGPVEVVE